MLIAESALKGYMIEASDGKVGTVKTFLFEDTTWKIRWLVVDTGHWLTDRQVLIHPSAIAAANHDARCLEVRLTKEQIEASPSIQQDRPVTMQMQSEVYGFYGWAPYWGPNYFGAGPTGFGLPHGVGQPPGGLDTKLRDTDEGDPHLRSMAAVEGYNIHATDGTIGHVESFLIDDASWTISYLIVDTRNWWPGAHVLISPYAVKSVDWSEHAIGLSVSCEKVRDSPPWDPTGIIDRLYEQRLHTHYAWPGYGW